MLKKLMLLVILCLCACYQVERTSGRVLSNANSVIKSGARNMWIEPGSEEDQNQEEGQNRVVPEAVGEAPVIP